MMDVPAGAPVEQSSDDVVERIRELWINADEGSISGDLDFARGLAAAAPPHLRAEVGEFLVALARLERWLHDF